MDRFLFRSLKILCMSRMANIVIATYQKFETKCKIIYLHVTFHRGPAPALSTAPEKLSIESSGCNLTSFTRLDSHHSNKSPVVLPRSALTSCSTSLEVTDQDQGMFVFNGERNVPYGIVLILLLFFASFSSYNSDSHSKNPFFKSSSKNSGNRLGLAMIGSVTEILSPILPFTGGMDLRQKSWRNWFGLLINSNTSAIGSQNILLFPRGGGQQGNIPNVAISGKKFKITISYYVAVS